MDNSTITYQLFFYIPNLPLSLGGFNALRSCLTEAENGRVVRFVEYEPSGIKKPLHHTKAAVEYCMARKFRQMFMEKHNIDMSNLKVNAYGKWDVDSDNLHFNWSHDGCVCFIEGKKEVGVDIVDLHRFGYQGVDSRTRFEDIFENLKYLFSNEENMLLETISDRNEKILHFAVLWSAKEAILKCKGIGLSVDTSKFTIVFNHSIKHFDSNDLLFNASEVYCEHFKEISCFVGCINSRYICCVAMNDTPKQIQMGYVSL
ncbi:holo-[acyl-carrier-protein] synthase [Entamoeba marina]